jgi:hypothetical protein
VSIWPGGIRRTGADGPGEVPRDWRPWRHRRRETIMKFLGYTLGDPNTKFDEPTPEMYARMGAFIEEATKAGVLLVTGGVGPAEETTKVTYTDGEYTIVDGPFTEAKELIGGWALMECKDKDEAIEWTKRFLAIAGPGESRIRPVYS